MVRALDRLREVRRRTRRHVRRANDLIQYLGYAGHDNLGDDAILDVYRTYAPQKEFRFVPAGRDELLHPRAVSHALLARRAPLLLGGGTVIGRPEWRSHLERSRYLFAPSGWAMLGAGVEDPSFVGTRQYTSSTELIRWKPVLDRFHAVTVRGPRSVELLAEAGISARLVGDPALLLKRTPTPLANRPVDVVVNVTRGEDQWGGLDFDWLPAVAEALRPIVDAGGSLSFVSLEASDDVHNIRLAGLLGLEPRLQSPRSFGEFFDIVERAKVVLGTRLHANVLAAACGTPNISLEYRPKCRDFMESIGEGGATFRIDQIDRELLTEEIAGILDGWDARSARLVDAVGILRQNLNVELRETFESVC